MNTLTLFAGCIAIWGTTWLAITYQLGVVPVEASVAYRFLLAAALIAAYCWIRRLPMRFSASQHAALALFGLLMYSIGYLFVYRAELQVASGLVAVGYSAGPLLAMFGMRFAFGQPITARMTLGALLGIAGVAIVYLPELGSASHRGSVALGALFTAAAVLVTTFGNLVAHRNHEQQLTGWPTMAWSMAYGGIASLVAALAFGEGLAFDWSPGYVASLLYLTVFGSILAFAGFLELLGRIGPSRASYVGVMVPIVALVISALFENFAWHPLTAVGVAISVAGNVLVLRRATS
ncbi:MAG TPA: EamA family transporter [Burkholderiales bacterium]|nr:EamA family transporter [Burkholderiales bacterium]